MEERKYILQYESLTTKKIKWLLTEEQLKAELINLSPIMYYDNFVGELEIYKVTDVSDSSHILKLTLKIQEAFEKNKEAIEEAKTRSDFIDYILLKRGELYLTRDEYLLTLSELILLEEDLYKSFCFNKIMEEKGLK